MESKPNGATTAPASAGGGSWRERYTCGEDLGARGWGRGYAVGDGQVLVVFPAELTDEAACQAFRARVEQIQTLAHPGVVPIVDLGVEPGHKPWIVERAPAGQPLAELLDLGGSLPASEALSASFDLLNTLEQVHAAGICPVGVAGCAVWTSVEDGARRARLLQPGLGLLAGQGRATPFGPLRHDPNTAAPELVRGEEAGAAADVYALAVLLYEMLCGRHPIPAPARNRLQHRLKSPAKELPSGTLERSSYEARLRDTLTRALAKEPAQRFASVRELALALLPAEAPLPAEGEPVALPAEPAPAEPAKRVKALESGRFERLKDEDEQPEAQAQSASTPEAAKARLAALRELLVSTKEGRPTRSFASLEAGLEQERAAEAQAQAAAPQPEPAPPTAEPPAAVEPPPAASSPAAARSPSGNFGRPPIRPPSDAQLKEQQEKSEVEAAMLSAWKSEKERHQVAEQRRRTTKQLSREELAARSPQEAESVQPRPLEPARPPGELAVAPATRRIVRPTPRRIEGLQDRGRLRRWRALAAVLGLGLAITGYGWWSTSGEPPELAQLREENSRAQLTRSADARRINDLERNANLLRAERRDLQQDLERLRRSGDRAQSELTRLTVGLEQAQAALRTSEAARARQAGQLADLAAQVAALTSSVAAAERAGTAAQERADRLGQELRQANLDTEQARRALALAERALVGERASLKAMAIARREQEAKLAGVVEQLEATRAELAAQAPPTRTLPLTVRFDEPSGETGLALAEDAAVAWVSSATAPGELLTVKLELAAEAEQLAGIQLALPLAAGRLMIRPQARAQRLQDGRYLLSLDIPADVAARYLKARSAGAKPAAAETDDLLSWQLVPAQAGGTPPRVRVVTARLVATTLPEEAARVLRELRERERW